MSALRSFVRDYRRVRVAEGYASTRAPDANNRQVVRVGPFPTYDLAKAVRKALANKYPGATIVP